MMSISSSSFSSLIFLLISHSNGVNRNHSHYPTSFFFFFSHHSATVDTMLIKEYGNKDGNQHPFFLQLTSQATAAANFKRQRRRRVSRESILPGHNVGHAVAVTFLAVRLCFRVLRCLWYVLRFCHSFRIYKECLQLCRLQLLRSYNFVILI